MPTKLRLLIGFCLIWIYGCGIDEVARDKNYAPKVSVFEAEADIVEPGSRVATVSYTHLTLPTILLV